MPHKQPTGSKQECNYTHTLSRPTRYAHQSIPSQTQMQCIHMCIHTYIKCLHILIDHGRQIFFGILSLGNGSGLSGRSRPPLSPTHIFLTRHLINPYHFLLFFPSSLHPIHLLTFLLPTLITHRSRAYPGQPSIRG